MTVVVLVLLSPYPSSPGTAAGVAETPVKASVRITIALVKYISKDILPRETICNGSILPCVMGKVRSSYGLENTLEKELSSS